MPLLRNYTAKGSTTIKPVTKALRGSCVSRTNSQVAYGERSKIKMERLDRKLLLSNIASVSSNRKWLKILEEIESQLERRTTVSLKLLMDAAPFEAIHLVGALYEDFYLEGDFGAITYKEIEWVEFFTDITPQFNFEVDIEVKESSFVIYGYRVS